MYFKYDHLEFRYDPYPIGLAKPLPDMSVIKQFRKRLTYAGRLNLSAARLISRFEFSMLPADGGNILPHTDSPPRVITLVVPMVDEGEWDTAFGGGTDLNQAKEVRHNFNQTNEQGRFEDMDVIDTFEFTPNQDVIFIRTFNSWHSVRHMPGAGSKAMRKRLPSTLRHFRKSPP